MTKLTMQEVRRNLKKVLKERVRISEKSIITFLITGLLSVNLFATEGLLKFENPQNTIATRFRSAEPASGYTYESNDYVTRDEYNQFMREIITPMSQEIATIGPLSTVVNNLKVSKLDKSVAESTYATKTELNDNIETVKGLINETGSSIDTLKDKVVNEYTTKVEHDTLSGKVDKVEETANAAKEKANANEETLATKADQSKVNTLSEKIDTVEQTANKAKEKATSNEEKLATKADISTVNTLSGKVDKVEETANAAKEKANANEETLATKADQSTVNTLSEKIDTVEQTANEAKEKATSNEVKLDTKADKSSLESTNAKVSNLENDKLSKTEASTTYATKQELTEAHTKALEAGTLAEATANAAKEKATSNEEKLATKADQSALDDTNTKVEELGREKLSISDATATYATKVALTEVDNKVDTKADKSTVNTLSGKVDKVEETANAAKEKANANEETLATKADQSTVNTLSVKVDTVETTANEAKEKATSNEEKLATKADQSALDDTNTKVEELGREKLSISDATATYATKVALTEVDNKVDTKADKSSLEATEAKVSNLENDKLSKTEAATTYVTKAQLDALQPAQIGNRIEENKAAIATKLNVNLDNMTELSDVAKIKFISKLSENASLTAPTKAFITDEFLKNNAVDLIKTNIISDTLSIIESNKKVKIELNSDIKTKLDEIGTGVISANETKTVSGSTVHNYVEQKMAESQVVASGIANAVAMASLPVNFADGVHSHGLAASYGNYGSNHAFAFGLSGQGLGITYKLAASVNTQAKFSIGAGLGYMFYKQPEVSTTSNDTNYMKLEQENASLRNELNELKAQMMKIQEMIEKLK